MPPDFGMAFISTPLVPDSPLWPENEMFTSSYRSGERLMFVRFELRYMLPMRMPSIIDTPSPGSPPCTDTCVPV